jgi:hypothetical protein
MTDRLVDLNDQIVIIFRATIFKLNRFSGLSSSFYTT